MIIRGSNKLFKIHNKMCLFYDSLSINPFDATHLEINPGSIQFCCPAQ